MGDSTSSTLVERLLLMADQGDFGRKPDPEDIRRQAVARIEALEKALEEIADPLAAMQREASASGQRLSGIAYQIANDPAHLKSIARKVLGEGRG